MLRSSVRLLLKKWFRHAVSETAAVGPLMALMLIPISGAVAMAVEMGQWYYFQRSMQNAADTAAIAAATNNSTTGSTYIAEAKAAAAPYGFVDGQNSATVGATVVTCPTGVAAGATCYQASLSKVLPISFSALVGFRGDAAYGSGRGQTIVASAIATAGGAGRTFCITTLSTANNSLQSNGGPKPDLGGCSLYSNGDATCNGHDLGADYGYARGTNRGCGVNKVSNAAAVTDNFAALANYIPTNNCGGNYPKTPSQTKVSSDITANVTYCGDVQLTKNVAVTKANTTITIFNGTLDLAGNTLSTASGASVTVIFGGTTATNIMTDSANGGKSGSLDLTAPSSGNWSGVAMYQDPRLTSMVDTTYAGNKPTWNISGLVYLPKTNLTFSGAVNKSSNGATCFGLVAYTILVNGTGSIFANNTQCPGMGLNLPGTAATREKLVQ
ncbi:pilus assembly protein TadG-related protein [Sphingobium estronivorans]|uniref:pilus assembly protein TadG-related protein n=1 Tax=Sphingobium estronivorans TaxID=1577690 RepID=UPI00123C07A3|nr:pilus assembly protein TadG-related protein [Sphingobium estronivorans]